MSDAVHIYDAGYLACGEAPATCDPSGFTASTGPVRANLVEFFAGMAAQGMYFGPGDEPEILSIGELRPGTSGEEAEVDVCIWSTGVVYGPPGPDGNPTVVNDEKTTLRFTYRLVREVERWVVSEEIPGDSVVGANACTA